MAPWFWFEGFLKLSVIDCQRFFLGNKYTDRTLKINTVEKLSVENRDNAEIFLRESQHIKLTVLQKFDQFADFNLRTQ